MSQASRMFIIPLYFPHIFFLLECIQIETTIWVKSEISLFPLSQKCPLTCGCFKGIFPLWERKSPIVPQSLCPQICKSYLWCSIDREDGRNHHRRYHRSRLQGHSRICGTPGLQMRNINTNNEGETKIIMQKIRKEIKQLWFLKGFENTYNHKIRRACYEKGAIRE